MSDKLYRIRRKSDGLFSTGRSYIYFTDKGKTWTTIGGLCSHVAMIYRNCLIKRNGKIIGIDLSKVPADHPYHDCEIVEAEVEFQPKKDVDKFVELKYNFNLKPAQALK